MTNNELRARCASGVPATGNHRMELHAMTHHTRHQGANLTTERDVAMQRDHIAVSAREVHESIARYEEDKRDGRIKFAGEFATDYPGQAATDAALGEFVAAHTRLWLMYTRHHYVSIAGAIRDTWNTARVARTATELKLLDETYLRLVYALMSLFRGDNDNFAPSRFLQAATPTEVMEAMERLAT